MALQNGIEGTSLDRIAFSCFNEVLTLEPHIWLFILLIESYLYRKGEIRLNP